MSPHTLNNSGFSKGEIGFISAGLIILIASVILAVLTQSVLFFFLPVLILLGIVFLVLLFREPLIGLFTSLAYSFLFVILDREVGGMSYGTLNEALLISTWLSVWYNSGRYDFKVLNNNLVWLSLIWFIISVMELGNPNGGSFQGWMQEIRTSALYPLLIAPLGCLLINTRKKLNYFLILLLLLSFIASLNGIKQIKIGLSPGEQRFLDEGASSTHLLFGKLRVFSFFSDAGQFGASQAQFVVLGIVLAIGLRGTLKKTLLFILGAISFYGLLISGTRGALFALMAGIFCALLLSKNYKVLIIGGIIAIGFIGMLKYTYIGNSNYNIYRLRTALDPEDASLNVRLNNQAKLADYMASRPFGGGLGVIGTWGVKYNADKFLSTIPPDSYWVKVWAMYGIIGFIIFFSFWMYLIGKCCGMIWNVKDQNLRLKLIALISGVVGIFLCSYGNEVMNTMPSLNVIQLSMGTVYIMCLNYRKEQQAS
ncbi:hypothetical protein A8C56_05075 [Niabella ginsenosidivorans]|uniref:O-antigen ligase-related domain-containing protein n=1 Tax=Niabella ginsenosidivorans TaxID=1176587 RepID=A0A1A9HZD8_9BACT|nr:hypothetical protein A8C56_05075 [Niabella ginsenosidivorans]